MLFPCLKTDGSEKVKQIPFVLCHCVCLLANSLHECIEIPWALCILLSNSNRVRPKEVYEREGLIEPAIEGNRSKAVKLTRTLNREVT